MTPDDFFITLGMSLFPATIMILFWAVMHHIYKNVTARKAVQEFIREERSHRHELKRQHDELVVQLKSIRQMFDLKRWGKTDDGTPP